MRIYVVTNTVTGVKHLVQATSRSQAVSLIASEILEVAVPKPIEVANLMAAGAPFLSHPPLTE